jgi:hypothetical protein
MSNGGPTDDVSAGDSYLVQLLAQAESTLAGASTAQLKSTFFDVLREFFNLSNSWQETISLTVIPDLFDYDLAPVSGRIMRLWAVTDQNNVPQQAIMPIPPMVHFLYPFSDPQPMTAIVVKNVDSPLECFPPVFPEWVLQNYGLGLLDGLIGRMMAMPGQSYSQPDVGKYYLSRFRDATYQARVATRLANTVGGQAWLYPQQYRTTSQRGGVSTFNVNPSPMPLR